MSGANNITERQIKTGLWLAKYRATFKKGLVAILVILNLWFWGYSLFGFFDYFVLSAAKEQALERSLGQSAINWLSMHEAQAPASLEWGAPEVISGAKATDFIMQVRNPNLNWLVRFQYSMALGEQIVESSDFVLPGTTKYLFQTFRGGRGAPNFVTADVKWQRVEPKDVNGDYATFSAERLNFSFENAKFTPANKDLPGRVEFSVWDKGAFSFWQPRFIILLWRGDRLAGINSVSLERFLAGEKREVGINWFDQIGAVSRIEIAPDVDIFDPAVYMPPAQ